MGCERESGESAYALASLHSTEKGLLQNTGCSLHPKLSERDKIKKSYFHYEAVQFLTLLIKPKYLVKAQRCFIAVLQPCRPVANCMICAKGEMA